MTIRHLAAALMGALAICGQTSAAIFDGATGAAVTDYSEGSALSFDIDFSTLSVATLRFTLDAADLAAGQLSFNSLVRNLTGLGIERVTVSLDGLAFGSAGSLTTDGFSSIVSSGSDAQTAWASFSPALGSEFYIGNPLAVPGAADWMLSLAGHQVGDSFSVTVAVPEPQAWSLAALGLFMTAVMARRRRPQQS